MTLLLRSTRRSILQQAISKDFKVQQRLGIQRTTAIDYNNVKGTTTRFFNRSFQSLSSCHPPHVFDNNSNISNKSNSNTVSMKCNFFSTSPSIRSSSRSQEEEEAISSISSSSSPSSPSSSSSSSSSETAHRPYVSPFDEEGNATAPTTVSDPMEEELIDFPESNSKPILMNAKTHAVGYLSKVLNSKVYEAAIETELQLAKNLSALLNNTIYLKREDTQPVFSFKIRGAYNKMAHLSPNEFQNGVVACSAGNHAQGVALSAKMLGCKATIVMPLATPSIKVNSVRIHGGDTVEVRLFGNNYDEAAAEAKRLVKEENMTMIHPFDDPYVIAGQGTIGMEVLKDCVSKPLDAIFVCCGGGGMLAGIAAYVKRVRPNVKVIGVEAEDAAGMTRSLEEGEVVTLDGVGLFADGAAVKRIGDETFRVCNTLVDEMVTVTTEQICNAIKLSYNDARVVLEPAGALGVAGMRKYIEQNDKIGKTYVAITSGANMDFDRLRYVSERADASERTVAVTIPETPGSFRLLYSLIWPRNVTEFSYRFETEQKANVLISFQPIMNVEHDFDNVVENLEKNEFETLDLSHNELAKTHIRHLAGGRATVPHERLFRFEFPESPGALQRFLLAMDISWNVSLFHYRNHGDDFGRVLVGIQVPHKCDGRLTKFLDAVGYKYYEETGNPVYKTFLRHSNGTSEE